LAPSERRKLLLSLFEQVWAQEGRIVAVQPHEDFVPYSQAASRCRAGRGTGGVTKAGATGLEPAIVTPSIAIRL